MDPKTTHIWLRKPELIARLARVAKEERRTKTAVAVHAIERYCAEREEARRA